MLQYTLKKEISFAGIGLHSGNPVKIIVKPAPVDSGIKFVRTDIGVDATVDASLNNVNDTSLATTLASKNVFVGTIEHLMSAFAGLGIDNAIVAVDSDELPIMDGSAGPFVQLLKKQLKKQKQHKIVMRITKKMLFADGGSKVVVKPAKGFKVTCAINFDHPVINSQTYTLNVNKENYIREIAAARTFGFLEQVEYLRANGKALGGSLENAIVIDKSGVVNDDGLRFGDEFARHKALDLIGDLALLGCPIEGHVVATKAGHTQHVGFMKALAENQDCWELVRLEGNGQESVIDIVKVATKAAGKKILPYLIPPSQSLAQAV